MKTGSNSAIVWAMVARSRRTAATADRPQIAALAPNAIQVLLWGALSSGIRQLRSSAALACWLTTTDSVSAQPAATSVKTAAEVAPRNSRLRISSLLSNRHSMVGCRWGRAGFHVRETAGWRTFRCAEAERHGA